MPVNQRFQPKADVLTFGELDRLCAIFVAMGIRKLRLSGGEPLLRRGFTEFVQGLSRYLDNGALDEITLTTNGTQLAEHAAALRKAGIQRVNVSMDSLNPLTFSRITRGGDLNHVIKGIDAALAEGIRVKINIVALSQDNASELPQLISWAHERGIEASLIETMPLGAIEQDRTDQYLPLNAVRKALGTRWTLEPIADRSCGPARYVRVAETGGKLGFITPLSNNFCASCNRVRLTATGTLFMCLGQEESADLRAPLRAGASSEYLQDVIRRAIARKPEKHDFLIARGAKPTISRPMSRTGG